MATRVSIQMTGLASHLRSLRSAAAVGAFASLAALWPTAVHAQPRTANSPTGLVCNEWSGSGNRGTWLEVDWHNAYGAEVRLGGLGGFDPAFLAKFFPELKRVKPKNATISATGSIPSCQVDETKDALLSCAMDRAVISSAFVSYFKDPDEISIRRSLEVTKLKLEVVRSGDGKVEMKIAFAAKVRARTVSYAYSKQFPALHQRATPQSVPGPGVNEGCAVLAGISASKLRD